MSTPHRSRSRRWSRTHSAWRAAALATRGRPSSYRRTRASRGALGMHDVPHTRLPQPVPAPAWRRVHKLDGYSIRRPLRRPSSLNVPHPRRSWAWYEASVIVSCCADVVRARAERRVPPPPQAVEIVRPGRGRWTAFAGAVYGVLMSAVCRGAHRILRLHPHPHWRGGTVRIHLPRQIYWAPSGWGVGRCQGTAPERATKHCSRLVLTFDDGRQTWR